MTITEKAKIDVLVDQNYSGKAIADAINRSKSCVNDYISRKRAGRSPKKQGRPPLLSERTIRVVNKIARRGRMTAAKVQRESGLPVSVRTIQRVLHANEHLRFGPLKSRPLLTFENKKARKEWADNYAFIRFAAWRRVIFSDEKRFSLDGPDGHAHYWADQRLPADFFSKRNRGGGGIMVWASISWEGKTDLVVLDGTLNAGAYVKMLQDHLEPFIEAHHPQGCVFQQDGAPAHSAKYTRDYFMEAEITDMKWPPHSPDLNCIENLWGELSRRLYEGGRQFSSVEDLKEALWYEWDNIELTYVRKLIKSMPCRAEQCHTRRGNLTDY